jgi:hypothetical protein
MYTLLEGCLRMLTVESLLVFIKHLPESVSSRKSLALSSGSNSRAVHFSDAKFMHAYQQSTNRLAAGYSYSTPLPSSNVHNLQTGARMRTGGSTRSPLKGDGVVDGMAALVLLVFEESSMTGSGG